MAARLEQLRPSARRLHDTEPSERDILETFAIKGANAYQAGLESLGIVSKWELKTDELLAGDHVMDGKILLGGVHARAVDIARDVITGAIAIERDVDVALSDEEVMAVGELYMFAHPDPETGHSSTQELETDGVEKAWKLIGQNQELFDYVIRHPDCFYLPE